MTLKDRLGPEEYQRRIEAVKKVRREEAQMHWLQYGDPELDKLDREIARQFNEDYPDGCERCYEPFDAEMAEVVTDDGVHLIVHVTCIGDDPLA